MRKMLQGEGAGEGRGGTASKAQAEWGCVYWGASKLGKMLQGGAEGEGAAGTGMHSVGIDLTE